MERLPTLLILFAGYHNDLNQTIINILNDKKEFTIEFCSPEMLEQRLKELQQLNLNLVIADLSGFSKKPEESIAYLKELNLGQYLLVIHLYQSPYLIKPLLEAGTDGYIPTNTTEEELFKAIKVVTDGKVYPAV